MSGLHLPSTGSWSDQYYVLYLICIELEMGRNQELDMRIQATLYPKATIPGVPISSMGAPRSVYLYSLDISICMVCKYESGTLYDPLPQQSLRAKIFIPLICLPKALHASSRFILYTNISKKLSSKLLFKLKKWKSFVFPKNLVV